MMKHAIPSTRYDRRTGQYVPTLNGIDLSPTSFEEQRAREIAEQAARPTFSSRQPAYDGPAGIFADYQGCDSRPVFSSHVAEAMYAIGEEAMRRAGARLGGAS